MKYDETFWTQNEIKQGQPSAYLNYKNLPHKVEFFKFFVFLH